MSANKIFVGQVPPQATAERLRETFAHFGEILDCTLLINRETGLHRGCGFVTFADVNAAARAIQETNEIITMPGAKRSLIVRPSGEKKDGTKTTTGGAPSNGNQSEWKLYVGLLSRQSTEDDVRQIFEPYGQIEEIVLMRDRDTNQSKGVGFVKYRTRDEAQRAINALNGTYRDKQSPGTLQVRYALTKAEKDKMATQNNVNPYAAPIAFPPMMGQYPGQFPFAMPGMPSIPNALNFGPLPMVGGAAAGQQMAMFTPQQQAMLMGMGMAMPPAAAPAMAAPTGNMPDRKGPPGANLFVYNTPDYYTDADLLALFSSFGNVISCKIQRDPVTKASKGYGFVSYDAAPSASLAIQNLGGSMIGNKRLDVRLKTEKNAQY